MFPREIDAIVLHHTASPEEALTWQQIRDYHIQERGFLDIGYHFGVVFDDKEWSVKPGRDVEHVGAHARGFNRTSIGVAVEGNYSMIELEPEPEELLVELCVELCKKYAITPERVFAHREVGSTKTECPGLLFPLDRVKTKIKKRANSST